MSRALARRRGAGLRHALRDADRRTHRARRRGLALRGLSRHPGVRRHEIDERDRTTILVHYYRAMVGRADVWRMRMDATTNWSIGATAAVVSFGLGNEAAPHVVLLLAPLATICFLLLEARRLAFHRLWQDRVLTIERVLIRPVLAGASPSESGLEALASELGETVPTMPLSRAVARRLRRVYGFLFAIQLVAWALKLANHPAPPAATSGELVARAHVGIVPGEAVVGAVLVGFAVALGLAAFVGGRRRESPQREERDG